MIDLSDTELKAITEFGKMTESSPIVVMCFFHSQQCHVKWLNSHTNLIPSVRLSLPHLSFHHHFVVVWSYYKVSGKLNEA